MACANGQSCSTNNCQLEGPQTPLSQVSDPGYLNQPNMSFAMNPFQPWGTVSPGVLMNGQPTPTSPGIINNDLITMLIKRLDSMDNTLARLDSIQTTVNSLNCRMQNMEKNDQ